MSNTTHSPLPWSLYDENPRVIVAADDARLSLLGQDIDGQYVIWKKEDAELIVRAVNAYHLMRECAEVLKPFANFANAFPANTTPSYCHVSFKHCRQAAALLARIARIEEALR